MPIMPGYNNFTSHQVTSELLISVVFIGLLHITCNAFSFENTYVSMHYILAFTPKWSKTLSSIEV